MRVLIFLSAQFTQPIQVDATFQVGVTVKIGYPKQGAFS